MPSESELSTKLTALRARKQRAQNVLEGSAIAGSAVAGNARWRIGKITEAIAETEKQLFKLRRAESIADGDNTGKKKMRKSLAMEATATSPMPPIEGWRLTCTTALTVGSKTFHRGQEVAPDLLASCANFNRLIEGGHIRWTAPQSVTVKPAPVPMPPPAPVVPVDHIAIAVAAIMRITATGKSFSMALDLIDANVLARAQSQYAESPRQVHDGGFAAGANVTIQNGRGTARRSVAGFIEMLHAAATADANSNPNLAGQLATQPTAHEGMPA